MDSENEQSTARTEKAEGPEENVSDEDYESSDQDDLLDEFDEKESKEMLFNNPNCTKVILDSELQKEMCLEIGVNVTAENPWKLVKKDILEDYLTDNTPETAHLRSKLETFDSKEMVLVGYVPDSKIEDVFIIFDDEEETRKAAVLIEKLEAFERRKVERTLTKRPRVWKSYGSEKEVNEYIPVHKTNIVDVNIQSVYPVRHSDAPFSQRTSNDVRDGYIELVPRKDTIKTVYRKRIDAFIQSAPPKTDLEQQTDPTFPTNAWSQYLYEIQKDIEVKIMEISEEKPDEKPQSKPSSPIPEPEPIIEISPQIQNLLNTLEFNQIDLYRNDYPTIGKRQITKFQIPYMIEKFCFAYIAKTSDRYVSSIDFHPMMSGIFAVSYAWNTLTTSVQDDNKTDIVNRSVHQPNPVLLWSFDDNLSPKLELESPREVYTLSFCPYDEDLLIGGLSNGQLILWDLKDRIKQVETKENLTAAQLRYRETMRRFLYWTKQYDKNIIVRPAAISSIEYSQTSVVTSIKWLNRKNYFTLNGQLKESTDREYRYFVTSSLDGTVAFWNLDNLTPSKETKTAITKKKNATMLFDEEISPYKKFDRIFHPYYVLILKKPITDFLINDGQFRYEPINIEKNRKLTTRVIHRCIALPVFEEDDYFLDDEDGNPNNTIIVATTLGEIINVRWEGKEIEQTEIINKESIRKTNVFDQIHDSCVTALDNNPFLKTFVLSIGGTIVAIWKKGIIDLPIYWRKRPTLLTSCQWSKNRPSVFFLTRDDGTFEAWDLLSQTDGPCLEESLGGNIITIIKQHKTSLPQEAVAIGDFNSSVRILLLPYSFTKQLNNETELLKALFDKEISRKAQLQKWQTEWAEKNKEIIEAKKLAIEQEKIEELHRIKIEKEREEKTRRDEEEKRKKDAKQSKKNIYDLPEKLDNKRNEMTLQRLMKIIMIMKQVDPTLLAKHMEPEREKQEYDARKKQAIKESFAKIDEELAILRSKILPIKEKLVDRREIVKVLVDGMPLVDFSYEPIAEKAKKFLDTLMKKKSVLTLPELLHRGRLNRELINKNLGSNDLRRVTYSQMREERLKEKLKQTASMFLNSATDETNVSIKPNSSVSKGLEK